MTNTNFSRRVLLRSSIAGLGSVPFLDACSRSRLLAETSQGQSNGIRKNLITKTESPYNAEAHLASLADHWITPLESFFVRSNGAVPKIDLNNFSLTIDGLVDRPSTWAIRDLIERFPSVQATATLTCAGNRRNEFNSTQKVSGLPWNAGAMGNAEWKGLRLSDLLKSVGIKPDGRHVWFEGVDQVVEKGKTTPFGGSVPLNKVMTDEAQSPGVILATQMNGSPLLPEHGFPIRAVVPGFVGARNVKWLGRITISDRPSPNHFVAHSYKIVGEDKPAAFEAASPLYEQCLNSLICSPEPNSTLTASDVIIKGLAIASGFAGCTLKKVEISTDSGQSWKQAEFTSPIREFCWSTWSTKVPGSTVKNSILVRAEDSKGTTQPKTMAWNAKGYQYNAWHEVKVAGKE